jgi:hypothetical protein
MWQNHAIMYPQFHHPRHDDVRISRERSRLRRPVPDHVRMHRHTQ